MTKKQIEEILNNHKLFLDTKGERGCRAFFLCEDLRGFDFSNRDLRGVNFKGSNLSECNLSYCNLTDCIFTECDMTDAILDYSVLDNADFIRTKLIGISIINIQREWKSRKKYIF